MAQTHNDLLSLTLTTRDIHDMNLKTLPGGEIEIHTTGDDPYVFTEPLPAGIRPQSAARPGLRVSSARREPTIFRCLYCRRERKPKSARERVSPQRRLFPPTLSISKRSWRCLAANHKVCVSGFRRAGRKDAPAAHFTLRRRRRRKRNLQRDADARETQERIREGHLREYLNHVYP